MMEKFGFYLVTYLLIFIGLISRIMPSKSARAKIGIFLGWFFRIADKKRRIITLQNIQDALPELSNQQHIEIMKGSYNNLGITLVELLAFPSFKDEDFHNYIKYDDIDLINRIYDRKQGLILISGHFGNWELIAFTVSKFANIPMTVIVKPQKNYIADKILNDYRSLGGNKMVPMSKAAKSLLSVIKSKESLGILVDQSANESVDIFVDFFGKPALTYITPAAIALKYNIPIVIGFTVRQPDNSYFVEIRELKFDDLENNEEGIKILTQRHVEILEDTIRKYPHLWSWQHRRWKHNPKKNESK